MKTKELTQKLLEWYQTNGRNLPWRFKGGAHPTPYIVLVSEIMLQQTTVKTVIPYFTKFIQRFPNIPELCQKYVEEIIKAIYNGELKRNETYPYKIQRTLEKESGGKIKLDLTDYKYSPDEAKRLVRAHYNKTRKFDKKG